MKKLFTVVMCIFAAAVFAGCGSTNQAGTNVKQEKVQATQEKENTAPAQSEYILSNGMYVAGKDFAPGTYDVVAVKGSGNASCASNGLNAILASPEKIKEAKGYGMDMYNADYKNCTFKNGDKLHIERVTVKLVKK